MINIANILRSAPVGTELYSPACGPCTFFGIGPNNQIAVKRNGGAIVWFRKDGTLYENGELLLFPKGKWHWHDTYFGLPPAGILVAVKDADDVWKIGKHKGEGIVELKEGLHVTGEMKTLKEFLFED